MHPPGATLAKPPFPWFAIAAVGLLGLVLAGSMTVVVFERTKPAQMETREWPFERLFLEGPNRYGVLKKQGGQLVYYQLRCNNKITLHPDVPSDLPMYYATERAVNDPDQRYATIKIHIHSVQDVDGGRWDGKQPGSRQVVE